MPVVRNVCIHGIHTSFTLLGLLTCRYPAVTDLQLVDDLSGGKVDLTFGRCAIMCMSYVPHSHLHYPSALDIFGGSLVSFDELVVYNSVAKMTGNLRHSA